MVSTRTPLDIGRVMAAAEAASPLDAVESVACELGLAFEAVAVSFLITDLSGRALVRLAHVPLTGGPDESGAAALGRGERREDEESATVLPFDGGPEEQALRTQTVQVLPPGTAGDGDLGRRWRVLAPVTERGESIGVLELYLPGEPDREDVVEVGRVAHLLAFVVIANAGTPTSSSGDSATRPSACRRRSSSGCFRRRGRARRPPSRWPGGWSRRPASAGTPSTTAWPATSSTCRSPTRWGTASRRR
jgi:hypothetical protein